MIIKKLIKKKDETGRNIKVVSEKYEYHSFQEVLTYCLNDSEEFYSKCTPNTSDMIAYQFRIIDSNEDFGICCHQIKNGEIEHEIYFDKDPFYD